MEEIFNLYYQINSIYIKLRNLEYDGSIESVEFVELMDVLRKLLLQEKSLFDSFYDNVDNLFECHFFDNGEPFVKRMIDYMNFHELLNFQMNEDDSEEEISDKINDVQYGKLYKSCSRNVFLVYLSFLQEYIDDIDYTYIRDKILSFKYYNAFINHDVEECLIDFDFKINKVNYVNLYFIAETLGIDINICDNIILDCFKDMIEVAIGQILSVKDDDYNGVNNYAMVINNQAMLRAGLALMSVDDFNKNSDWLFGMINELSAEDNQISFSIVNAIINSMHNDKTRVMKISMRPLKG